MEIRTVLVADDDPAVRRIAELSLARVGGFRVVLAATGPEALDVAARERPDVIVLDVMMGAMDGVATLAALRAREATRGTPVVFMTARALDEEAARLVGVGAAGVIRKPFDPMKLPAELRRLAAGGAP
ncbi:MAG: response regulator [Polyangiales bacterium]